jgi:ABC-type dipeptide/oligopeptide/nickel transport system permease subunit
MTASATTHGAAATALRDADGTAARRRRRTLRNRLAILPGAVLVAFVLAAVLAPWVSPYDPNAFDLPASLQGPTARHLLGTDQLGRDTLSRLIHGGRATLLLSALATVGVITLGLVVGVVAGYFGGWVDAVVGAVVTALLAIPSLLLTLAILGVLGASTTTLLVALIGAGWVGHARVFRAAILAIREQPYVESAVSLGASPARVIARHLLPNLLTTTVVLATLDFGGFLLTVSALSFLGLGVQPPTADWGTMLNDGRPYFDALPILVTLPGVCIALVALSSDLLGDALRDTVDLGR